MYGEKDIDLTIFDDGISTVTNTTTVVLHGNLSVDRFELLLLRERASY